MLTNVQRAIIKSTVPLLEAGGEALTKHMYNMLLSEFAEVRPLFNPAHQASGDQPRALANGILMYAKNIDRLEALGDLSAKIVNKHVSLQIQPEHYPIVGACLLRSIREVLGAEIATDAVIAAWGAGYQQLADILIQAEEQAYAQIEAAPGGWRGERAFRVTRKEPESSEITSFYMEPADGGPLAQHLPGQHLGLRLQIAGQDQRRSYSLSAAPNGKELRISVKRQAGGLVSNYLHDHVSPGDLLQVFPPAGIFTLAQSVKPLVLISAGVGITPTVAMLQQALKTSRPIYFIHCARNRAVHAFRETVDGLRTTHPQLKRFYDYSEVTEATDSDCVDGAGRLDKDRLAKWLPSNLDVDVYFLGPQSFMALVKRNLKELGVPESQTHFEFFGPASALN
jgi:nitric oxide dioxygenase